MISLAPPPNGSANRQRRAQTNNGSSSRVAGNLDGDSGRLQRSIDAIDQNIWLPDSPMTFAFYLITIVVLCGGLFLHINLSAQITQTEYDIAAHISNYNEIERESAEVISQIAIATSMFDINRRAIALGYQPVKDSTKNFVAASEIQVPQPQLATAASGTALAAVSTNSSNGTESSGAIAGITVAEALEVTGNTLTSNTDQSLNNAIVVAPTNNRTAALFASESDGLADRLVRWWRND